MKPLKTKSNIRDEINQQVEDFLQNGGAVNNIERGISGNEKNLNLFKQTTTFSPKQERTPVTEVVKELEARKTNKGEANSTSKRPKKVLITDDFGEPLRWFGKTNLVATKAAIITLKLTEISEY